MGSRYLECRRAKQNGDLCTMSHTPSMRSEEYHFSDVWLASAVSVGTLAYPCIAIMIDARFLLLGPITFFSRIIQRQQCMTCNIEAAKSCLKQTVLCCRSAVKSLKNLYLSIVHSKSRNIRGTRAEKKTSHFCFPKKVKRD